MTIIIVIVIVIVIVIIIIIPRTDLCCVHANFLKRGPTDDLITRTEALLKILILIHNQPQQHGMRNSTVHR